MERQTYNKKAFLLPDSPRSMASYHAKVMEDGVMKLTMHDCRGSIQLYNDLNNPVEITEALEKLNSLVAGILDFIGFIETNYENKQIEMAGSLIEQLHNLNLTRVDILTRQRRFQSSRHIQSV